MLQTILNLILVILVTFLHIFINFKIAPLITNFFIKFVVQLSSSILKNLYLCTDHCHNKCRNDHHRVLQTGYSYLIHRSNKYN